MKEEFCTYEISLKLKELGFDKDCLAFFNTDGKFFIGMKSTVDGIPPIKNSQIPEDWGIFTAPLWQQAIDWFREKCDIIIDVAKIYNGTDNYHFALNLKWEYFEGTYPEAREAAILKAINIVSM
jgi:hypothetical protein